MNDLVKLVNDLQTLDKFKQCTCTSTTSGWSLNPYERVVAVNPTSGSAYVTLPPVCDCAGMEFSISLDNSANPVYITDFNNDAGFSDLTVSATSKIAMIRGDGRKWATIAQS